MFSLCLQKDPTMSSYQAFFQKQVAYFLCMTGSTGRIQNPWKSVSFHEDGFCLFRMSLADTLKQPHPKLFTARKMWSFWIKLLWICTSTCPSKCLLCTPFSDCAQTVSLQLCLSFCPPKQTPAETQNQSSLQPAIICNPWGALNLTLCPERHQWIWYNPPMLVDMVTIEQWTYHGAFAVLVTSMGKHLSCGHNPDVIWPMLYS